MVSRGKLCRSAWGLRRRDQLRKTTNCPLPPRPSSPSQSNSVNSHFLAVMLLKRLPLPIALTALVVLAESPPALTSKNTTRLQYYTQDLPSSNFTLAVSFYSGVWPIQHQTDGNSGIRPVGTTEGYESPGRDAMIRILTSSNVAGCPPCFNCRLPRFKCGQFGECDPYDGQCKCPPGWGGIDCLVPRELLPIIVSRSVLTCNQSATRSPMVINEG